MRCTNYSLPLFKTLKSSFNTAAADYIASIIESEGFAQWYGDTDVPNTGWGINITNKAGATWDVFDTVYNWLKQEEYAAGFRSSSNERLYFPLDEPVVYKKLQDLASDYNKANGPFTAEVVRLGDSYAVMLDFNKDYKNIREKGMLAADPQPRADHQSLFFFNNIDAAILKNGKKDISIRGDLCKEGLYQVGNDIYRVSLKYPKAVFLKEVNEKIGALKERMINDEDASEYKSTKDFLAGRTPMFIYDVKRVADLNEEKAKALPDFQGMMALKPHKKARGAKFLTGYTDVDKYLKVLAETKESLYRQRTAVRTDLKAVQDISNQIDIVTKQMDRLHKEARVDTITAVGHVIMAQLKRDMDNAQTFDQMNEALRLAGAWREIDKVVEFNPANPDEDDLATLEDAKEIRSLSQTLYQSYFNKFRDKVLDMIDEKLGLDEQGKPKSLNVVNEEGNIRILDVDRSGALGIGIAFSANEIEQLVDHLIKESEFKALDEDYEFNKQLEHAIMDLTGKGYKHSKASDFNFLFTKDHSGNSALITKYNRDFYKELYVNRYRAFDKHRMSKNRSDNYLAAISLGATVEEMKKEMSEKEYYEYERSHYNYVLSDEGKQEFEKYMEAQKHALITGYDEANDPIYDEAALKKIRDEYDPERFQAFLDGDKKSYNKGNRWFTKELKDNTGLSKEYQALSEKQRSFYQFFTSEFIKGQQDTVVDYRFTDADMDREILDFVIHTPGTLKDKTAYMGKKFRSFVEGIAGVRFYDDENVRVPSRALTGVEHIGIEFKHIGEFIPDPNGTTKANPVEILKNFRLAGHMFKQRRQVEDKLNAVRDLALNAEKAETTPDGRFKKDLVGKVFTSKHKTNVSDRIEYNVKAALTGKVKEPYTTAIKGGKPGEWKFSANKTLDSINNYTRFKAMALSPMSATGNFIMGSVNNITYAAGGQYFNDKQLAHAYWLIKGSISKYWSRDYVHDKNAAKIAEILHRYNLIGDVTEKLYHDNDFLAWFFTLQKSGEFVNQGATSVAQMLREKVTLADGTEKSMWDMFELDKDKKVGFRSDLLAEDSEWHDPEKLHFFFEKIRKVNQKIHGDYQNPLMIKKDVIGRVFMLFRTWLPMAVKERFGSTYHDYLLGEQKGRYVSLGQKVGQTVKAAIANQDFGELKELGKLMAKIALPVLGRRIKLKGSAVDVANINMAIREMHFIMMLAMTCLALKAAVHDDDDDDDGRSLLRYLYNQGERAQSELEFFFSPKDLMQITRDVVPLYQTFRDGTRVVSRTWTLMTDPDEDQYKRGFRKGHSKAGVAWQEFAPVLRSVQKTWSASEQIFSDQRYQ